VVWGERKNISFPACNGSVEEVLEGSTKQDLQSISKEQSLDQNIPDVLMCDKEFCV